MISNSAQRKKDLSTTYYQHAYIRRAKSWNISVQKNHFSMPPLCQPRLSPPKILLPILIFKSNFFYHCNTTTKATGCIVKVVYRLTAGKVLQD